MSRRKRAAEDLSVDELRQILMEKRRSERNKRLDHYRRTGRVIQIESAPARASIDTLTAYPVDGDLLLSDGPAPRPPSKARTFLDRLLFLIEVAAVLGLAYVLFNGVNVVRSLNQEVVAALEVPTPSPTPLFQVVVLPSGHTPPRDGVTRFNEDEIPEHLRPLVQSQAQIPLPTPGPQHAVNIKIPAINISSPVVQGDNWEQLKKGVGQHLGTPNPGDVGNMVLSAHNDVYGMLFRDLDQLQPGDEVILYTQQRAYTYIVRQTQVVEPTAIEVLAPTREPVVTLISCYPYLVDNQRIVVTAYLADGE